jgi:hypothetical protein
VIKRSALTAACALLAVAGAVVVAAPASAADLPDTYAAARNAPLSTVGTAYSSSIDDPTDQDWFRFDVKQTTKAAVTLGDLPGDYTLTVFDGAGRQVARSAYGGKHFERVLVNVAPGTYYARVTTQGFFAKTKPYRLRFRLLPVGVVALDNYWNKSSASPHRVVATIYNNTGQWQWIGQVDYAWYDSKKKLLRRDSGGMQYDLWVVPPGGVRPFGWRGSAPPKGAASVTVTPRATAVKPSAAVPAVTVSGVSTSYVAAKSNPYQRFAGTASGGGSKRVDALTVAETFNANGTMTGWSSWVSPVGAGRTDRFSFEVYAPRPNTYRIYSVIGYGEPRQ